MKAKYLDCAFELKNVSAKGVFEGYGSVFGERDSHSDIVMPGAFAESLKIDFADKGRKVPVLWQHDQWNPIGVYEEIREDEHGLFVKGQLNMRVQQGIECHALMEQGALSGLSIGYNTKERNFITVGDESIRQLTKVKLWEVSPVTFPSGDSARVETVKSMEDLTTLSDIEGHLRDAYGVSKKDAAMIVARVKAVAPLGDPAGADTERKVNEALAALRSININF